MIDEDGFRKIYDNHVRQIYNLCLQYLQNKEEAEEATQDIFVKVYRQLDSFKEESSLRTWIYRIAINRCLDIIKYKKRIRRFSFNISMSLLESGRKTLSNFNHPGVDLESKEAVEFIFSCINQLPEKQKTVIILKFVEQLSQNEIASILNTSEKAVESLLSRARKKLKNKLK